MFRYATTRLVRGFRGQIPVNTTRVAQCRLCSNSSNDTNKSDPISKLIDKNQDVAYFGRELIERTQKTLMKYGFSSENSLEVIKGHPQVVRFSSKQLEKRLEAWHLCNFSKTQFYELLVQCPELLECDDENFIASRFSEFERFAYTPKNVWRLLMSSPNILVDDIRLTKQKVDYIFNDMEADETDLVKSGALGQSLNRIKSRHMLLVRLGVYKKRNWKASEMNPHKNPRLFRINDVDDEVFASKLCGISLRELEAFYELYERELEEKAREAKEYDDIYSDDEDSASDSDEEFDARQDDDHYDDSHRRRYKKNSSRIKKTYKVKPIIKE